MVAGAVVALVDTAAPDAVLRQAIAGLDAARVTQDQTLATLARSQALGSNIARTVLDDAASAVRSSAQEVARLTALRDQAQIQLTHFTIRAPMAGTVLTLDAEPGQTVDPASVLLTLADLSQLVVETDTDEVYATQIRAGLPAVLQLAGEATRREGQVSVVSQRVDPTTGGLAVQLTFDLPVTAPVGLTVAVNIIVDQQDAALTVPRSALLSGDAVLVLAEGIAIRRSVTVIDWPAARLVVTDGLVPGDIVIVDSTGITEGQTVSADQP